MGNRLERRSSPGRMRPPRSGALAVLLAVSTLFNQPVGAWYDNPGFVPLRRDLPNAIDMMESGLYWMQDLSGIDNPRDPASVVALLENQAARFFDFAYIAYLVAGPEYASRDALQRAHFQNRIRDRLFSDLAYQMGMYDARMPTMIPLVPRQTSLFTGRAGGIFYHRGGPTIQLVFEFYLTPRGWRIYDINSNGVSAVDALRRIYMSKRFGQEADHAAATAPADR